MTRVLVAGVGNVFAGDDGFGCAVAAQLGDRPWPAGVEVVDFGIRGVHLAYQLLDGYTRAVIVDAMSRGESAGTIYVAEHADDPGREPGDALLDAHDMDPDAVLALVPALGGTLPPVVVVGCEPESLGPGIGLSAAVGASVDTAARLVTEIVNDTIEGRAGEPRYGSEGSADGTVAHAGGAGRRGGGRGQDPAGPQAVHEDPVDVSGPR